MTDQLPDSGRISRSVDEARAIILDGAMPLPPVDLPLADALAMTMATPLVAEHDSPSFATAAMDGFAISAEDVRLATQEAPAWLSVVGVQPAGTQSAFELLPGTAIRIMTGAPCPPGADAVVPFEQVSEHGDGINIPHPIPAGANIRPRGGDYRAGDQLLAAGASLTPAHIALLAANGRAAVPVRPRPRVAVVAAGNELRGPGAALKPGQIWDSNSVMVAALCRDAGAAVPDSLLVSDSEAEIEAALERAAQAGVDLILTVGGISAGDYDHLKHVLTGRGNVELWDVAMRPGRPLAFGQLAGKPVIGLPGNPAAAFVSFHQFVRPLLARLMGRSTKLPMVTARAGESFQNPGGRRAFIRVSLARNEGDYQVHSAGPQGSANILSLARANGLLVIPENLTTVAAGERVDVEMLSTDA